ncbi:MAG: ComEC/Rec2 family competence protein [bacterium]
MSKANILAVACLSFLIGIFLDSFNFSWQILPVFLLVTMGAFVICALKKKSLLIPIICVLFLVFGFYHHKEYLDDVNKNSVNKYNGTANQITIYGTVVENPTSNKDRQQLVIETNKIVDGGRIVEIQKARVLISLFYYPKYQYGDYLKLTGRLVSPPVFNDFNYRDYLKTDRIYSLMYWPQIEVTATGGGSVVKKILFSITNRYGEKINQIMSPPQSALLMGLILGDDSGFSKAWQERFNLTATRHITAVSGMNITLISFIILDFLLYLGIWRRDALIIVTVVVILYVLMIGAPSSAVRAGMMAIFMFAAQLCGRYSSPIRPLLFVATIMVVFNPLILLSDIGFQLSFLAMLGLIYFQPFINGRLFELPNTLSLRTTLSATLSAQIFTLPLIVYNFGRLSLIGPIANIVVVPLVPIITIIGFIVVVVAMAIPIVGQIISWVVWLLLSYMLTVIRFLAGLTLSSIDINNMSPLILVIWYGIIGYIAWRLKKAEQLKFIGG